MLSWPQMPWRQRAAALLLLVLWVLGAWAMAHELPRASNPLAEGLGLLAGLSLCLAWLLHPVAFRPLTGSVRESLDRGFLPLPKPCQVLLAAAGASWCVSTLLRALG